MLCVVTPLVKRRVAPPSPAGPMFIYPSSLRAKRSNPVFATKQSLDCFASLAMTAVVEIRTALAFARSAISIRSKKWIGRCVWDTPLSRSMTAIGGASAVGQAAEARKCSAMRVLISIRANKFTVQTRRPQGAPLQASSMSILWGRPSRSPALQSHPRRPGLGPGPITIDAHCCTGWSSSLRHRKRSWLWAPAFAGATMLYFFTIAHAGSGGPNAWSPGMVARIL